MPTIVVPFRADGKTRLPPALRLALAQAMLADVVDAAVQIGRVVVVGNGHPRFPAGRVEVLPDPGGGQGAAVAAGLAHAHGPALVVNADLPFATADALRTLASHGSALVPAADGTTNALSLPEPAVFRPLYGPGSAGRFAALGLTPVSIPELERDVDTLAHLDHPALPLGPRTGLVTDRYKAGMERVQ